MITENVKQAIEKEYNEWFEKQYGDNTKEDRQKAGQFFTPPELTCKMLEKIMPFNNDDDIVDPTAGSGNLLAAAILAGANPKKVYYNELDPKIFEIGKTRLMKMGVPEENFYCSDILKEDFWNFLRSKNVIKQKSFLDSFGKYN